MPFILLPTEEWRSPNPVDRNFNEAVNCVRTIISEVASKMLQHELPTDIFCVTSCVRSHEMRRAIQNYSHAQGL